MEIEKKIDEGIFKYSKKRRSDSKANTPENKKPKLIDAEQLDMYLKGDSGSSTSSTPVIHQQQIRINPTNENMPPLLIPTPERQKNFFSQYLAEPNKTPKPFKAQPYISPMDYPWFYPSYYYEGFYAPKHPPSLIPPPHASSSIPPLIKSPKPGTPLEQKNKNNSPTIPNKDLKTHTMNTRSSSTTKGDQNIKKQQTDHINKNKRLSPSKPDNNNKQEQNNKSINKVDSPVNQKLKIKKEPTLKKQPPSLVKDVTSSPVRQNMLKNSKRKPPQTLSQTNKKPQITSSEKRLRNKEKLKFRYSLRQRTKALKKAKKLAKLQAENAPRYILKKLDKRTSTRKELFLATLGLRRILKRIDNPPAPQEK